MKIVAAGGGSAGHVTPVLAVLRELKKHDANLKAYFVTDHAFGGRATSVMAKLPFEVPVKRIQAGKIRRYHRVGFLRQLFDVRTNLKNFVDIFRVGVGFMQSLRYLRKVKPDVVFAKGGYVCVPLGLAAHLLKIPLVIHDSDSHPGLANRILAKYATAIGTGAPTENYPYPKKITKYVGIPVSSAYRPVTPAEQRKCRAALGLTDIKKPLIMVTGGGLGSRNLNHVILSLAPSILPKAAILQLTGDKTYQETLEHATEHVDYIIKPFLDEGLAVAYGAASIVITRAGATTMGELASMAKPVIIVPSPYLTAGHQLKNAEVYEKAGAAIVLDEEQLILNPLKLKQAILGLLDDTKKQKALAKAIHNFARPDAAIDMAAMVVDAAFAKKQKAREVQKG